MTAPFPLPMTSPAELGLADRPLAALDRLIHEHIADGRYPGAQIAIARHGRLALYRCYGDAAVSPTRRAADADTLFLLFSNTKMLTMAAVWTGSIRVPAAIRSTNWSAGSSTLGR